MTNSFIYKKIKNKKGVDHDITQKKRKKKKTAKQCKALNKPNDCRV